MITPPVQWRILKLREINLPKCVSKGLSDTNPYILLPIL